MKQKTLNDVLEFYVENKNPLYIHRIKQEISNLFPKEQLHTHDSIPCYIGEEKRGCILCYRNNIIREIKKDMGIE